GRQVYDWERVFTTVRALQPDAVIFSDAGPDVRWVGNEDGVAGTTTWSTIDPTSVPTPGRHDPWTLDALRHGDPDGSVWRPAETDVSIRPGWFWHPDEQPRDAAALFELYLTSVGRGSKLLLNVPPTRDGLLDDADVAALRDAAAHRRAVLGTDLLADATATTDDDGGLVLTPATPVRADLLGLAEDITEGQHVAAWRAQADHGDGVWRPLASGTTIGHRRLVRVPPTHVHRLRLVVDLAYGPARATDVPLRVDDGIPAQERAFFVEEFRDVTIVVSLPTLTDAGLDVVARTVAGFQPGNTRFVLVVDTAEDAERLDAALPLPVAVVHSPTVWEEEGMARLWRTVADEHRVVAVAEPDGVAETAGFLAAGLRASKVVLTDPGGGWGDPPRSFADLELHRSELLAELASRGVGNLLPAAEA